MADHAESDPCAGQGLFEAWDLVFADREDDAPARLSRLEALMPELVEAGYVVTDAERWTWPIAPEDGGRSQERGAIKALADSAPAVDQALLEVWATTDDEGFLRQVDVERLDAQKRAHLDGLLDVLETAGYVVVLLDSWHFTAAGLDRARMLERQEKALTLARAARAARLGPRRATDAPQAPTPRARDRSAT